MYESCECKNIISEQIREQFNRHYTKEQFFLIKGDGWNFSAFITHVHRVKNNLTFLIFIIKTTTHKICGLNIHRTQVQYFKVFSFLIENISKSFDIISSDLPDVNYHEISGRHF